MIIAALFNFALLLFILWYFGKAPLQQMLNERKEMLSKEIQEAGSLYEVASQDFSKWEGALSNIEADAVNFEGQAKEAVQRGRKHILETAEKDAARIKVEAKLMGDTEAKKLQNVLQKEVASRSIQAAQLYLNAHFTEKDHHKVVAEYLESVHGGT